jgi:hypothetical protein
MTTTTTTAVITTTASVADTQREYVFCNKYMFYL